MVRVIEAGFKLPGDEFLGKFVDHNNFDTLVEEDCDFYGPANPLDPDGDPEQRCVFKFRKNVFSEAEQHAAYEGLIGAAGESQNRGLAAGPRQGQLSKRDWVTEYQIAILDALQGPLPIGEHPVYDVIARRKEIEKQEGSRGTVWLRSQIEKIDEAGYEGFFDRWLESTLKLSHHFWPAYAAACEKLISKTTYANPVLSGIAGFFDRYPRYPYGRVCAYNAANPERFDKSLEYIRHLNAEFKALLPNRWATQNAAAQKMDPKFMIGGDTVFTTLTVNRTFRTAAHLDAGDLGAGFSNLGVILPPGGANYKGGYLVLPEYRAAVNVRPGDLLLISNHDVIHGNTPIEGLDGVAAEDVVRMSVVAYFRENMLELGSFDYEMIRRDYVESRRLNKDHPLWRPLWNGVSEGMFSKPEWFEYLAKQPGGQEMLVKYHSGGMAAKVADLEDLFD